LDATRTRVRLPRQIYSLYERQLAASLPRESLPRHVGVILDGNRRWAKSFGEPAATGHRRGADKISEFLGWSEDLGIQVVTLWMLSPDSLNRSAAAPDALVTIGESTRASLAECGRWRLRTMASLGLPPESPAAKPRAAPAATADVTGLAVNVAI